MTSKTVVSRPASKGYFLDAESGAGLLSWEHVAARKARNLAENPSLDDQGEIDLRQAAYIRHIAKDWFRLDMVEYGRPGEPARSLSVF